MAFKVDSVGSMDDIESVWDLGRRYHSSGTANRKRRFAWGENGLGIVVDSTIGETREVGDNLVDSMCHNQVKYVHDSLERTLLSESPSIHTSSSIYSSAPLAGTGRDFVNPSSSTMRSMITSTTVDRV